MVRRRLSWRGATLAYPGHAYSGRNVKSPSKPGGRQPPFTHAMQTTCCRGRPFSRPLSETITSVEKLLPHASQTADSVLFSLAFSLGMLMTQLGIARWSRSLRGACGRREVCADVATETEARACARLRGIGLKRTVAIDLDRFEAGRARRARD